MASTGQKAVRSVRKATFELWFGVMVVRILGHFLDTARLAPRDHVPTRRLHLRGAPARRVVPGASVVPGFRPGGAMIARADTWPR